MRVFSHINELRDHGFPCVPLLSLLSERVTLWAPSFHYLKGLDCAVEPHHILRLVRAGRVHLMAREWWFKDRDYRNRQVDSGNWSGYAWTKHDDEVRELLLEDTHGKMITVVPGKAGEEDEGLHWARNLKHRSREYRAAQKRCETRELPPGFLAKMDRLPPEKRVESVLRDAWNHERALELSSATHPFEHCPFPTATAEIIGRRIEQPKPSGTPDLGSLTDIALRLADMRSVTAVVEDVENGRFNKDFGPEIDKILSCTDPLPEGLAHEINRGWESCRDVRDVLRTLIPEGAEWRWSWAGVAVWALSMAINSGLGLVLGVVGLAISRSGRRAIREAWTASAGPRAYSGPSWPFALALGRSHPCTRDDVKRVVQVLSDMLK